MKAIDCMTFAGGFTLGMINNGFHITAKREYPGDFARPLYEANITVDDTQYAHPDEWEPADADVLFGNPPCSGFSSLSTVQYRKQPDGSMQRIQFRGIHAEPNKCMWSFARYTAQIQPQVAIFESVSAAGRTGLELMQALHQDLETRTRRPWHLTHLFHSNSALGGHQQRNRYFWIASQDPFTITMPAPPSPRKTVRDAIHDLENTPLDSIDGHVIYRTASTERSSKIAETGHWRANERSGIAVKRAIEAGIDLGELRQNDIKDHQFAPLRISWDKPSPVITGDAHVKLIHPSQPRPLTYREIARIMGYPDTWTCQPSIDAGYNGISWWGKGIPVGTANWIAQQLSQHLNSQPGNHTGKRIGSREHVIDIEASLRVNPHQLAMPI